MIPEVTEADLLDKAVDILETRGWCQHKYGDDTEEGTKCAVGALRRASWELQYHRGGRRELAHDVKVSQSFTRAYKAVQFEVGEQQPDSVGLSIEAWNDEGGRTADEVIELLKGVAKDFRNTAKP